MNNRFSLTIKTQKEESFLECFLMGKKSYDYEFAAAESLCLVGSELRRVLKGQQLDQYCSSEGQALCMMMAFISW